MCRYGGSANKPFRDGTHAREGFNGAETASPASYRARARELPAPGVTVVDDRSLCEHAGFCGARATNVWALVREGATEDSTVRAQVMAMVEHCPSGALTYRLPGEDTDVEPDPRTEVGVVDDGPLFLSGRVRVSRADGTELETRNRVTLCRSGASANKPFCDGSHRDVRFRDTGKPAVPSGS